MGLPNCRLIIDRILGLRFTMSGVSDATSFNFGSLTRRTSAVTAIRSLQTAPYGRRPSAMPSRSCFQSRHIASACMRFGLQSVRLCVLRAFRYNFCFSCVPTKLAVAAFFCSYEIRSRLRCAAACVKFSIRQRRAFLRRVYDPKKCRAELMANAA